MIILAVTVAVGFILYVFDRRSHRRQEEKAAEEAANPEKTAEAVAGEIGEGADSAEAPAEGECCGMHIVCEKDTLSPFTSEIEYYDDEELDRFVGRSASDYTPEEVEEFREVLMTLIPEDLPGWARSITQRRIELPSDVRDELLLLINEQRDRLTNRKTI